MSSPLLPATGAISFSEILSVLGGEPPVSMSKYYVNAATGHAAAVPGIPTIGASIPMSAFRGKGKPPSTVGIIPAMSLTNDTTTVVLSTYFSGPGLTYSVISDPDTSATITPDGVLSIVGAYRSKNYTVTVQATNASGVTVSQNVEVIESVMPAGTVEWAARLAGAGSDNARAITTTSDGGMCVTGQTISTIIAYNSDGTTSGTPLAYSGGSDVFIAKYSAAGAMMWFTRLAGTGTEYPNAITTTSDGGICVTGSYDSNQMTVYNADGTDFGTVLAYIGGGSDVFLAKYSDDGSVQWVTRVAAGGNDQGTSISAPSDGGVCVGGYYGSNNLTAYHADGTAFGTTLPGGTNFASYLVKYSPIGNVQWVTRQTGSSNEYPNAICATTNGGICIVGRYGSNPLTAYNADGTAFGTTLPNSGGNDAFLAKYSATGAVQWLARLAGTGGDQANTITTTMDGGLCVGGLYTASITAYNSDGTAFGTTLTNIGDNDAFLAKYSADGTVQWVTRLAGTGGDQVNGISATSDGGLCIVGLYSAPLTAYHAGGTAFETTLINRGGNDAFLAKYSAAGAVEWVISLAGTGVDSANAITTTPDGCVCIAGTYASTPLTLYNADGSAFHKTLPNSGGNDAFIAKYRYAQAPSVLITGRGATPTPLVNTGAQFTDQLVSFDGASHLSLPPMALNIGTRGFTALAKFRWNGSTPGNYERVFDFGNGAFDSNVLLSRIGTTTGLRLWISGKGLNTENQILVTTPIQQNTSYVVAVRYDPVTNTMSIWIDGVFIRSNVAAVPINDCIVRNVFIGRSNWAGDALAKMDLVSLAVHDRALTDTEVIDHTAPLLAPPGTVEWAARLAGISDDQARAITSTPDGGICVAGSYSSPLTAYHTDGTAFDVTLTNIGITDVFLALYSTRGTTQWIARITGTDNVQTRPNLTIATTSDGGICIAGYYTTNTLTAYNADGSAFSTTLANSGGADAFLTKYSADGNVHWVARLAGMGNDYANAVSATSDGGMCITGDFASLLTAYNADGMAFGTTLANSGSNDAFVAKYSVAGAVQWVARLAGTGGDMGRAISTTFEDSVCIAGHLNDALTVYNSDGTAFGTRLMKHGEHDGFLAMYSSTGYVQWVARLAGSRQEWGNALTTTSDGGVCVAGRYTSNPLTAYNADGTAFGKTLANSGDDDAFVAKYSTAGAVQWVARLAGTGADQANAISATPDGGVCVVGYYTNSTLTAYNADDTAFGTTLDNSGGNDADAFLAKYSGSGEVEWLMRLAGTVANAIGTTPDGCVCIAGSYASNPLTLYNADWTAHDITLPNSGSNDAFVAKVRVTPATRPAAIGTIPPVVLGDNTAFIALASYFTGTSLTYTLTTDPESSASIDENNMLSLTGAYRGKTYAVNVRATNRTGLASTHSVEVNEEARLPPAAMTADTTVLDGTTYVASASSKESPTIYSAFTPAEQHGTTAAYWGSKVGEYDTVSGEAILGVAPETLTVDGGTVIGAWIQLLLPHATAIHRYSITPRDATRIDRQSPHKWTLLGSTDSGETWSVIHAEQDGVVWTSTAPRSFTPPLTPSMYNCVRLQANVVGNPGASDRNIFAVGNLEFYSRDTVAPWTSLVNQSWRVLYELDEPTRYSNGYLNFKSDNAGLYDGRSFNQVGYFMQNRTGDGPTMYWILVTMNAYTDKLSELIIPDARNPFVNKTNTTNLRIYSNHPQVTTTSVAEGRVEIWQNNYATTTTVGDGSSTVYDIDDTPIDPVMGHGCVQVHDIVNKKTLLAWNSHRTATVAGIGIGNNDASNIHYVSGAHPDWTFSGNGAYDWKFQVLIGSELGIFDGNISASARSSVCAIYSFKHCLGDYHGPVVSVRRSTDDVVQDFYANVAGVLGTEPLGTGTTLSSWLNGATGHVSVFYDQSGRDKHITQSNKVYQPTIGQSGEDTYIYVNNALTMSGPNVFDTPTVTDAHVFYKTKEVTRKYNFLVNLNGSVLGSPGRFSTHMAWGDGIWYFDAGDATGNRVQSTNTAVAAGTKVVLSGYKSSADGNNGMRLNGGPRYLSKTTSAATVSGGIVINKYVDQTNMANHYVYSIIVFNNKLDTSDESYIEANM